jgi:hypothetical protein
VVSKVFFREQTVDRVGHGIDVDIQVEIVGDHETRRKLAVKELIERFQSMHKTMTGERYEAPETPGNVVLEWINTEGMRNYADSVVMVPGNWYTIALGLQRGSLQVKIRS